VLVVLALQTRRVMRKTATLASGVLALVLASGVASAAVYNIHVGGVCSTRFTNGKGAASSVGSWSGEISINAYVDQRSSMATAVANLKSVFDQYCQGSNSCWVYTFSNGAAVVSKVLATYGTPWRIVSVRNSAGNEGGTEIAGTGWVGEAFGGCSLAGSSTLKPSAHRGGWNHNDTHGIPIVHIGGTGTIWWSLGTTKLLLPGTDDSVVAFHSAGGMSSAGSFSSLCSGPKYSNHIVWSSQCGGYGNHHLNIARRFVCLDGGC
jgi:hypothetical protein